MSDKSIIEAFDYGITREWQYNNALFIITSEGDISRAAIDVWADAIQGAMQTFDTDRPLFALIDLSHPNQAYTPYGNSKGRELIQSIPYGQKVYAAVIIQNTLIMRLFGATFNFFRGKQGDFNYQILNTREKGLEWLKQRMKAEGIAV